MTALIAESADAEAGRQADPAAEAMEAEAKEMIAKGEIKPAAQSCRRRGQGRLNRPTWARPCARPLHHRGDLRRMPRAEARGRSIGRTAEPGVAGGYSRAEFETLMTKGIAAGRRKLKALMAEVGKDVTSPI